MTDTLLEDFDDLRDAKHYWQEQAEKARAREVKLRAALEALTAEIPIMHYDGESDWTFRLIEAGIRGSVTLFETFVEPVK